MSDTKRQSLNINLDELFPGDSVSIGKTSILIRPLSFEQVALMSKKVKGLLKLLSDDGVTWENYNTPESILKIAIIVIDSFPDMMEEAANVEIDDIRALPIEEVAKIVNAIIAVNMKSKESLEKNLQSLTKMLFPETPEKAAKIPAKKIKKEK